MQIIKDWLWIFKAWLTNPINDFRTSHTIACPKCYKLWNQFRKYQPGQNTLCKDCRKIKN